MENIKIWCTPKEKLPEDEKVVVFYIGQHRRVGYYYTEEQCFYDFYTTSDYKLDSVGSWAYLCDLIATSKALEASIKSLEIILALKPRFPISCEALIGLREVNRIMNGGNDETKIA